MQMYIKPYIPLHFLLINAVKIFSEICHASDGNIRFIISVCGSVCLQY